MKLKQKLLLMVMIPIVLLGVGVALIASYVAKNALVESTRTQLMVACAGYTDDLYAF